MMGGVGSRFGAGMPKQFTMVNGSPIFAYILRAYAQSSLVESMTVVCNASWTDHARKTVSILSLDSAVNIISGGDSRSASLKEGLLSLRTVAEDDDCILIHDATHPYLDVEAVTEALVKMDKYGGVTLCQNQYDTCYSVNGESVRSEIPKKTVVSGASPEIFRYGDLCRMFLSATEEDL